MLDSFWMVSFASLLYFFCSDLNSLTLSFRMDYWMGFFCFWMESRPAARFCF